VNRKKHTRKIRQWLYPQHKKGTYLCYNTPQLPTTNYKLNTTTTNYKLSTTP
jgi:hypothetical protein